MSDFTFILIYFFYGLAFFSMGLLVALEGGRASDSRLRKALRPLAGFGLLHATHEWFEMFERIGSSYGQPESPIFNGAGLAILAFSFVSLAAFGGYLLAKNETAQRLMLVVPIGLEALWVFGLLSLRGRFPVDQIWDVADVWTRYSLAIPGSILAAVGLIVQQRAFRQSGLITFGRDTLWAAVAFGWYGLVGQLFTRASALPPSNIINQDLFAQWVGLPVQVFRALSAGAASMFVIRFLRAFQFETDRQIAALQIAQLEEAQQRETQRGELFRRVVAAQEAERQRIARDLHDETGQSLTAIGMGLRGLSTTLHNPNTIDQATNTLRHLETLAANSLTELQRLIADLRPSHLDDLGLSAALRWYVGTVQDRTGLKIKVEITGGERNVSSTVKTALFRVVQEALNNIVKHARAKNVNILLAYEEDQVRVWVKDDGSGFDVRAKKAATRRPSLGLVGMEERANLLGGSFLLQSKIGEGTMIEVRVPYHYEETERTDEDSPFARG
jgi:signal transduction histidine kinase